MRYVEELVLEDRDADFDGQGLDARAYALHDAQFSVTAAADASGAVGARYEYTPYGQRWFAGGGAWLAHGHQGLLHDVEGLVHNRMRDLHPGLGRFLQQDPIGYAGGSMSLYEYVGSEPIGSLDPSGLWYYDTSGPYIRYLVWAQRDGIEQYSALLRRTLFLGLSDGARIDAFRRANVGIINNEQVVVATEVNAEKWESLVKKLRRATDDSAAKFEFVFLIDDFVGSGQTLLREEPAGWDGKLYKFWNQIRDVREPYFSRDLTVCVHHYVASHNASLVVRERRDKAAAALGDVWFAKNSVEFSFCTILPSDLPIDVFRFGDFMRLVQECYDASIENQHTDVGGTADVRLGFGGCALPLVLEHNTPNNSIALLWADTAGGDGRHAMRPLFRRRQRHV